MLLRWSVGVTVRAGVGFSLSWGGNLLFVPGRWRSGGGAGTRANRNVSSEKWLLTFIANACVTVLQTLELMVL